MKSSIRASVLLTGDHIDLIRLTKAIGIKPTQVWKAGDLISQTILKRRKDGWMVGTRYFPTIDARMVVSKLLTKLRPKTRRIRAACIKLKLKCEFDIDIFHSHQDSYPILAFQRRQLDELAKLGAGLDVDIIGVP